MKKCDQCEATLLFGGVVEGRYRFCTETCRDRYAEAVAEAELPDGYVYEKALEFMAGDCPKCGCAGPVAVHTSHWIFSYGVGTSYKSLPETSCGRCGKIEKVKALAYCSLLGWWGPIGLIVTPFQILRNIFDPAPPPADEPTPQLLALVRQGLAMYLMAGPDAENSSPPPFSR